MQLRAGDGWQPVCELLGLDWVDRGCSREIDHRPMPMESIGWVRETVEQGDAGAAPATEPDKPLPEPGERLPELGEQLRLL